LPSAEALSRIGSSAVDLPNTSVAVETPHALISTPRVAGGGRPRLPLTAGTDAILAEEAARRGRQPSLGAPTHVNLFGSAAVGRSFYFLIDRSNSMGSNGLGVLSRAVEELDRALATLEPQHQFQILAYNHGRTCCDDHAQLLPANPSNKRRVIDFVRGLVAFGATNHFLAVMSALHRQPDAVFLLTDGGDPPLARGSLAVIRKQAAGRTTIHCLHFGAGPRRDDAHFLEQLARDTGGSYRYIDVRQFHEERMLNIER
jgi:hypothetical protein